MKIGIDGRAAKWYRGTGIGTYSHQLISSLNVIDKNNEYLLFMPEECDCDIKFNRNFNVKNITENKKENFWDEVNIPNILQGSDIEIYHVPQNGVGLPRDKRCPLVITLHDIIPYKMPETVGPSYLKIFTEQMPYIVSQCDGIITVSEFSKNDIIKTFNFPEEKIFVTHLAPEKIYKPINKEYSKQIIQSNYNISGNYILYIGGFSPRKNILGLIEAFSKLIKYYNEDIKLVIAGKKGLSFNTYKQRTEELNIDTKVIFPGFISLEHLPYLYNGSELFVYPSFYEGFGLPPVEAMACGTPVVASSTTSVPEIVGDSSMLVDPNNIDEIFMSMLNVLQDEDLRKNLIQNGFKRSSELTWENTARKTLEAYEQIIRTSNK